MGLGIDGRASDPTSFWKSRDQLVQAEAASRAEHLAAEVPLRESEHFTRARRRIREALANAGAAVETDGLVAELLSMPLGISPEVPK